VHEAQVVSYDNHDFAQENAWHPWHVSDRATELSEELDEAALRRLYDSLRVKTLSEWLTWLEDARKDITKYDWQKARDRKRHLQKNPTSEALMLHHACIFIELWRTRLNNQYFPLPPRGLPIDGPESQREMMLAVLTSYNALDKTDLWPFRFPDGEDQLPFRSERHQHRGQ
jgi:hypothetical protein